MNRLLSNSSSNDKDEEQLEQIELEDVRSLKELKDGDTLQDNLTEYSKSFYNIDPYIYIYIYIYIYAIRLYFVIIKGES